MNNPFDYTPDPACDAAFRGLVGRLEAMRLGGSAAEAAFCRELASGKMLGVMIAGDADGGRHTLYAFSGQLGSGGFHWPGFAGPVFDYLQPDGYFRTKEREISRLTLEIARFEDGTFKEISEAWRQAREKAEAAVETYRKECRRSKERRQLRRDSGQVSREELEAMIRQSQFEKAELRRMKKRLEAILEPYAAELGEAKGRLDALKDRRRRESESLQDWLFTNFRLLNARGESRSLKEIFSDMAMKIPPSGAGECCAPKLLQAAYLKGWTPLAMAEYWYGRPKEGELRIHGQHYPACRGKCLPVLGWMLQGLAVEPPLGLESQAEAIRCPEIIFENRWFCIVDKPAGMLSVAGKGAGMSVEQWLSERYGAERDVKMAHRLDQDTSGLLVATFGPESFKTMQKLFATRKVVKTYVADLDCGDRQPALPASGRISLPLSADYLDRPRQRVDLEDGKEAVTDYELVAPVGDGSGVRVIFHPLTGRTHQLRVHAASVLGLGMPIVGDRLYGRRDSAISCAMTHGDDHCDSAISCAMTPGAARSTRLHLHAHKIEFTFPLDGCHYSFTSPVPF